MGATAQDDDCPTGFSCVVYDDPSLPAQDDPVIEIDPSLGPVQAIIVSDTSQKTTDFSGVTETYTIAMAVFVKTAGGYEHSQTYVMPRSGRFANVRFLDVLALAEVAS